MKKIIMLLMAGAVLGIVSCKKENNNNNNTAGGKAYFNNVNASPGELNPDLYVPSGSAPLTTDFYYGMSTGYALLLPSSDQVFTVKDFVNGADRTVLTTPNLNATTGAYYSWFMFDTFPYVKYFLTKDDLPTSLPSGKGAIKFVNVSPNAGPLSYRLHGSASMLATNIKYAGTNPTESTSTFVTVDTGYLSIDVLDSTNTLIDNVPLYNFYVKQGKGHVFWTMGYRGGVYPYDLQERFTLGNY